MKKIIWQDIYTCHNETLEGVKEGFGKDCIYTSYGEIVLEDKKRIVLLQNDCDDRSDFIVIPKAVIISRED